MNERTLMKTCPKCHKEFEDQMSFCSYCGTKLVDKNETQTLSPYEIGKRREEEYADLIRGICLLLHSFDRKCSVPFLGVELNAVYAGSEAIDQYLIEIAKARRLPWASKVDRYPDAKRPLVCFYRRTLGADYERDVEKLLKELKAKLQTYNDVVSLKLSRAELRDVLEDASKKMQSDFKRFLKEIEGFKVYRTDIEKKDFFIELVQAFIDGGSFTIRYREGYSEKTKTIRIQDDIDSRIDKAISFFGSSSKQDVDAFMKLKGEIAAIQNVLDRIFFVYFPWMGASSFPCSQKHLLLELGFITPEERDRMDR